MGGNNKKKKVLLISFAFPPTNIIAAVRIGKFAKYLPEFGWEPFILTSNIPKGKPRDMVNGISESNVFRTSSFALASIIYNGLGGEEVLSPYSRQQPPFIKRIVYSMLRLLRFAYALPLINRIVTEPVGWYFSTTKKELRIVKEHKIDVIISTSPPTITHFIASRIHKRTGLPWVADFRDPWVPPYQNKIWLYEFVERRLGKFVLKGANMLTATSEPEVTSTEAFFSKKAVQITNGFDDTDYLENVPLTSDFSITYTGNIYPGKSDPTILFKAISELRKEGRISLHDIHVRFFGGSSLKNLKPLIDRYHLNDVATIYPIVPFKESIKRQKESTILLSLLWNDIRSKGVYSGKIFEYLGAQRPILGIGYRAGVLEKLLSESGTGVVVDEVELLKRILMLWFGEWREHGRIISYWRPVEATIKKYTRREQTKKLAQLFDEVLESSSAA